MRKQHLDHLNVTVLGSYVQRSPSSLIACGDIRSRLQKARRDGRRGVVSRLVKRSPAFPVRHARVRSALEQGLQRFLRSLQNGVVDQGSPRFIPDVQERRSCAD